VNKKFSTVVSFLISILFLYLSVKDINLSDLFNHQIKVNYLYLFLTSAILYLTIYIKAFRLKVLLKNYRQLNLDTYTKPILIRHFLNATLPGNLGEIAKPYILKSYLQKPYFECLSITIIERIFDLIIISLIFGVALMFNHIGLNLNFIILYMIFFFIGLISFIFLIKSNFIIKYFPLNFLKQLREGAFYALKDKDQIIKVSLITILLWIFLCLADFFLFSSFDVLSEILSIQNIIFLTGLTVVAQLIPSAPSSIGVFNYLIIEALDFLFRINNIDFDIALKAQITSISFIVLFFSILPDITWGFFVFTKETSIRIQDLKNFSNNN
jgi:uncharacterized protein (TIRG00374 family)